MHSQSPWRSDAFAILPEAPNHLEVDVAIVGGGITGLTAALFALREGKRVAVLEAGRVGSGETLLTTAHLTQVLDTRFHELQATFGRDKTMLIARSGRQAIQQIETIIVEEGIECDFGRVPGFLFTERVADQGELKKESKVLHDLDIESTLIAFAPLPFSNVQAIRVEQQAQFHPGKYVEGLVQAILKRDGQIFEHSKVLSAKDGTPCTLQLEGDRTVTAKQVLVAAHVPITNRVFLHTKLAAYRTYVIAFKSQRSMVPGLYWDTEDPYHYIRMHDDLVIVGGEDHKTGTETETDTQFEKLAEYARERFGAGEAQYRWSGQVIETPDGLPFLGKNPYSENIYVSTGYAGNGTTLGTLGAMLFRDVLRATDSPYAELYAPNRVLPLSAVPDLIAEAKDFPTYLVCDRILPHKHATLADLKPGDAGIVIQDGKKIAAYRAPDGHVQAVSAICTHLGCAVHWNEAEISWDCPCHGSRFSPEGTVLNGPAVANLKKVAVSES